LKPAPVKPFSAANHRPQAVRGLIDGPAGPPPPKSLQDLQRQIEYLQALHQTSLKLIEKLDKEELLEAILERAALMTGTAHGFIYLLEPGGIRMQMRVGMGFFKGQLGRQVRLGEGLGGKVWQRQRPIVVKTYHRWKWRLDDPALNQLQSVAGIPLVASEGIQGVIGLARTEEGRTFDNEDIKILSRFADLALIALEKAALYADVRRELAERQKAEGILRESENRYRSLLESSPDPVVVYTMDGQAVYVNPAFEQTFGWRRDELLGKPIAFVPEANWPETRQAIETMLAGQKIRLFDTQRLTKDGRVLDIQLSSTLYTDREGRHVGNIVILRDVSALKQAQEQIKGYQDHLEEIVAERTAALAETNRQLQRQVEERRRAETTLRKREKELQAQSLHLAEVNTALKVLIQQRENDKKELADNVLTNVRQLVQPYVERLKKGRLSTGQQTLVGILAANLEHIISPFTRRLSSGFASFTPMEVRVANLVKEGKTNKEIAELLLLSKNTVLFHRHNVRRKLGLGNQKINLRTHLLTLEQ